jgi:hypothetical protein
MALILLHFIKKAFGFHTESATDLGKSIQLATAYGGILSGPVDGADSQISSGGNIAYSLSLFCHEFPYVASKHWLSLKYLFIL